MHEQEGPRLVRYISGQSPAQERAAIEARMATDAEFREHVQSLMATWELAGTEARSWSADRGWQEFQQRRSAAARTGAVTVPIVRRSRAVAWAVRAAAAVVLLAGGALLWNEFSARDSSANAPAAQQFVAAVGERRLVRLPDGTSVTLAPASQLRLADDFSAGAREVYLEGQAEFKVTHDARRPFRIYAGDAVTEVLGTRFVIRAYDGDAATAVALVEGSVRLRAANDDNATRALTLQPGQVARVVRGAVRIDENQTVRTYLAWTEGELVFNDSPLGEVVRELGRWYNLDIRLADESLAQKRLTASFRSEPADQILDLIARALNLRYERRAGTVVFFAQ